MNPRQSLLYSDFRLHSHLLWAIAALGYWTKLATQYSVFTSVPFGPGTLSSYLSLTGLLTAIRGLNICSHLYLRVLSPPGPCQALTINYNNQTIWILKLSLFSQFNSSQSPRRPQLTRHWTQVFLLKKDLPNPALLYLPQAPPARNFLLLSAPLLACRMVEGGGTSFLWCWHSHWRWWTAQPSGDLEMGNQPGVDTLIVFVFGLLLAGAYLICGVHNLENWDSNCKNFL